MENKISLRTYMVIKNLSLKSILKEDNEAKFNWIVSSLPQIINLIIQLKNLFEDSLCFFYGK